jgi:hypothetical protein
MAALPCLYTENQARYEFPVVIHLAVKIDRIGKQSCYYERGRRKKKNAIQTFGFQTIILIMI